VEVSPGRGYRELASAYAHLGIAREVALIVPTFSAAAAVVAATDLVATLPESFMERLGKSLGIAVLTASAPRVSVAVKLAWHERTEHDASMRAFRDLVVSAVRSTRRKTAAKRRSRSTESHRY
jgi:DNA-binding transcriptional LysR family regulator